MTVQTQHSGIRSVQAPKANWPNFFIVGAAKCGTTSLWAHLKKHPQVFFPEMKEPHFFMTRGPRPENAHKFEHLHCVGNQQKYLGLYEQAESYPAIGDASITYLWDENAPKKIHEVAPHARIVIMLRDPVVRAHSHYLMNLRLGAESLSTFAEALRADLATEDNGFWGGRLYVGLGLYYEQVRRYIETFGSDQVLILLFDDLTRQPKETLARVTQHLGIDPLELDEAEVSEAHNVYKMPRFAGAYRFATRVIAPDLRKRLLPESVKKWLQSGSLLYNTSKPPLDPESRRLLQGIFDPDIAKLEQLLGRKLPELRKSWAAEAK